ncbi:MAG: prepilin-type N-terminal cleavage/methylation domain-containing protein [Gammaproteobacteria bacterium]|nr:prepilin-type N-terminal cleavage/methylation domain-containing protein [Gammaproteobacteria bacterium]
MRQQQKGFTLVEIAIVLVIIGLLLGGILKGQELINSARVRNLADSSSGIQAAYFGFIDRYRRVPGDWDKTNAGNAIAGVIDNGGNNNGRLDTSGSWQEANALWEHISKAGFISGAYTGTNIEPTTNNGVTPLNPFNSPIIVARTNNYMDITAGQTTRLHLIIGRSTPVDIARELDTKLDDSNPETGNLRSAATGAGPLGGTPGWGGSLANCVDTSGAVAFWDVNADIQDCNTVFFF